MQISIKFDSIIGFNDISNVDQHLVMYEFMFKVQPTAEVIRRQGHSYTTLPTGLPATPHLQGEQFISYTMAALKQHLVINVK